PSPKQDKARLNACASAPVSAFSLSDHSSPVPELVPIQPIVTSHVTRIFAAGPRLLRWTGALACTEYLRVQPAGVNSLLSRSLYARGLACDISHQRLAYMPVA